jgi:hypothetical protein
MDGLSVESIVLLLICVGKFQMHLVFLSLSYLPICPDNKKLTNPIQNLPTYHAYWGGDGTPINELTEQILFDHKGCETVFPHKKINFYFIEKPYYKKSKQHPNPVIGQDAALNTI